MDGEHMTCLLEYSSIGSDATLDQQGGVVRGVKVLGLASRNGRTYSADAVKNAIGMYEGIRVNVDHPGKPGSQRSYRDRFGHLKNVRMEADGLRADLHYNPKHPLAEQFVWDATHSPENVGFSHNADGRTSQKDGQTIVEEITRVHSVDLVADPATTKSLFESEATMPDEMAAMAEAPAAPAGSGDMTWDLFMSKAKEIYDGDGDPGAKATSIGKLARKLFKLGDDLDAAVSDAAAAASDSTDKPADKPAPEAQPDKAGTLLECVSLCAERGVQADKVLLEAMVALSADARAKLLDRMTTSITAKPRSAVPLTESKRSKEGKPEDKTEDLTPATLARAIGR
jgi:hypothetical protein